MKAGGGNCPPRGKNSPKSRQKRHRQQQQQQQIVWFILEPLLFYANYEKLSEILIKLEINTEEILKKRMKKKFISLPFWKSKIPKSVASI